MRHHFSSSIFLSLELSKETTCSSFMCTLMCVHVSAFNCNRYLPSEFVAMSHFNGFGMADGPKHIIDG